MTNEEAIFELTHFARGNAQAISMAIEALEKQIPIKPIETTENGTGTICPNCGETLLTNWKPNHCMHCSQAIDWSEE